MATAKEKVLGRHPKAVAMKVGDHYKQIVVLNVAPGFVMPLGLPHRKESAAWADAWRTIQEAQRCTEKPKRKVSPLA